MSPLTKISHPSSYRHRTTDKPPVWRSVCGGTFEVLYPGDGVNSSFTLGSVGEWTPRGQSASILIPGTKECPGAFGLFLGRFRSAAEARSAVEAAVYERMADPAAYDAAARIRDRAA